MVSSPILIELLLFWNTAVALPSSFELMSTSSAHAVPNGVISMAVTAAVSSAAEPAFRTTPDTPVPPLLWVLAISETTT